MKLLLPLLVFFLADAYCQESQRNEVLKGGVTVMTEQCGNELNKVWVDVFFLVDKSKSMTRNGFIDVLGEIATSMEELTIGQDMHEPVTRAGLITYGEDAKLVWDLDHWMSQDHMQEELGVMIDNARKNYIQTEGTNILAAIQLANERFNSSSHRKNVKPVIVIIATAYKAGNNFDPVTTAANAFKQNGGIIITYEFHQKDSLPVDILEKLASKGYHVSNRPGANALSPEKIPDLFAKANCFCPADYIPYVLNGTYEPNYGCYRAATTTTSQKFAGRICNAGTKGFLSKVENHEKALFLMNLLPQNHQNGPAWIGLKRDAKDKKKWTWPDGTVLTEYDFEMWHKGEYAQDKESCVTMFQHHDDKQYYWQPHRCTDRRPYTCQMKPCSAANYCSEVFSVQHQNSLRKALGVTVL